MQFHRVPEAQRSELVEQALQDGRCLARQAANSGAPILRVIAGRCNVPIIESHTEAGFGSTVIYAEYAVSAAIHHAVHAGDTHASMR